MAETQIGIDLGTTFSVVAVCSSGNTTVIPVDGAPIVPSVISFDPSANELVVGAEAVKRRMKAPLSTAYNVITPEVGAVFPDAASRRSSG